jgi:topoisomerase-4 subunit B
MPPAMLKDTTMDPAKRTLLRIQAPPETRAATSEMVENLMGKRPELRFNFIQENAGTVQELDI